MDRNYSLKGFTLVELTITIALIGILGWGLITFFKNTYDIWWMNTRQIDVQQQARTAMDEMSRFIRQSSAPASGMYPAPGNQDTYISFYLPDGRRIKYYQDNDELKRVVNGTTSTIIRKGLESIYFIHNSSGGVRIASMTVIQGKQSISFDKKISLRNW